MSEPDPAHLTILQRLQAAVSDKASLQSKITASVENITRLEGEITTLKAEIETQRLTAANLQQALDTANAENARLTTERATALAEVDTLKAAAKQTDAEVAEVISSFGFQAANLPRVEENPSAAKTPKTADEWNQAIAAETDPIKRSLLRRAALN